jgi:hypothetical protein
LSGQLGFLNREGFDLPTQGCMRRFQRGELLLAYGFDLSLLSERTRQALFHCGGSLQSGRVKSLQGVQLGGVRTVCGSRGYLNLWSQINQCQLLDWRRSEVRAQRNTEGSGMKKERETKCTNEKNTGVAGWSHGDRRGRLVVRGDRARSEVVAKLPPVG